MAWLWGGLANRKTLSPEIKILWILVHTVGGRCVTVAPPVSLAYIKAGFVDYLPAPLTSIVLAVWISYVVGRRDGTLLVMCRVRRMVHFDDDHYSTGYMVAVVADYKRGEKEDFNMLKV
jgi:hypothetical protein